MGRKKLNLFLVLITAFVTLASHLAWSAEDDEQKEPARARKFLTLIIGVDYDEKLPPIPKKITSGGDCKNLGIVSVGFSEEINSLRFSPKREGNCVYTLKDANSGKIVAEFGVTIRKSKSDAILHDMQALLGDIEGINFKVVNNKVIVDGQILLPRDMNRIYSVISQFGDQASSLVTLSPLAQKKIAEFIARDINNPEIEVRAVNDKFILQGVASSEDEKARAEIIAKTYVPAVILDKAEQDGLVKRPKPANDGVINLITVKSSAPPPPGKMIQLVVHYIELSKNYSKGFNFQFTPSLDDKSGAKFTLGGTGSSGGVTSEITGIISNFIPKLNWAKSHGHARVLESTSMIVLDGKQGKIDSSSDFPYQVVTDRGPSTQFKKVGIVSTITPTIIGERSDTINLGIDFQIDALNGTVGSAPLTSTNKVNTEIVVRSGQSAAIGGLIKSQNQVSYNNPDNVPKNPIISLYASKDFTRNQTQFVVFVTPIIKSSASAGSEKIKKKFRLRD
jgi:pilus assembly protein CpaC